MIPNFEELKQQLSELSGVINGFKSEAVQLKLVEIVFSRAGIVSTPPDSGKDSSALPTQLKKRRHAPASSDSAASARTAAGTGAIATLTRVFDQGFFKQARTISAILEHCETNLARKIKANEISGKLARMVRSNQLKRAKNGDGQYEYTNV